MSSVLAPKSQTSAKSHVYS